MKKIYLASPLGFAASTRPFMTHMIDEMGAVVGVVNPWNDVRFADEFLSLEREDSLATRRARLRHINAELGRANVERINDCDGVIAVLDGVDVDSGTAAEIGYAFAQGKRIFGIRTDFRLAGDNFGAVVNLQVEYFILASGGTVVTSMEELISEIRLWTQP